MNIALIGCGKMGSALLQGWVGSDVADHIYVLDPQGGPADLPEENNVTVFTDAESFKNADVTASVYVLAVKPQIMTEVCQPLTGVIPPNALILSIAAGKPLKAFSDLFGASQPVVRSMPNLPASIGKGMTVSVPNPHVTADQKDQADTLLRAAGAVAWIEDESLMHAVTALSGSGPAYVFLLVELLAKAGVQAGLPEELASTLARQTVTGSAALVEAETGTSAAQLRQSVTSPGGTTEAALEILMPDDALPDLLNKALEAAVRRGKALSE